MYFFFKFIFFLKNILTKFSRLVYCLNSAWQDMIFQKYSQYFWIYVWFVFMVVHTAWNCQLESCDSVLTWPLWLVRLCWNCNVYWIYPVVVRYLSRSLNFFFDISFRSPVVYLLELSICIRFILPITQWPVNIDNNF